MDECVIEWLHKIYGLPLEEEKVSGDWTKAIIITVYNEKGSKN